ncbi:MAG: SPOR domain-containing protein, partial [Bacteroidota bacterium]
ALLMRSPAEPAIVIADPPQRNAGGVTPEASDKQLVDETMTIEAPLAAPETSPLHRIRPLEYGTGHVTWMTSSLPSLSEAEARVQRFRSQGFNANVAPRVVDGQQYYGVTLGLFPSRATAEVYRSRLPPEVRAQDDLWILDLDRAPTRRTPQTRPARVDAPADGFLSMRSSATRESREITRIPHRSTVQVLSCNARASGARGEWCRVLYDGRQGWSYSLYLNF